MPPKNFSNNLEIHEFNKHKASINLKQLILCIRKVLERTAE